MARCVFLGFVSTSLIISSVALTDPVDQASKYRDLITALREDTRVMKIQDEIHVNTRDEFRLLFPDKCESDGEFELHALTLISRVEESFVLIPNLCLWIEVGSNEKRGSVQLDLKFINATLEQFPDLIFYHIQPNKIWNLESNFPSFKDLITLILTNTKSGLKRDFHIRHRLINNIGTVEYMFSSHEKVEKFIRKFKEMGLHGYESQNLSYEYMRQKYRNEYYQRIQDCKLKLGTDQQNFSSCFPMYTESFTLIYWPITK